MGVKLGREVGVKVGVRVGVGVMVAAARRIRAERLPRPAQIVWVATTQEEIGLRGASAAAFRIEPDFAVVVETTTAADLPGVEGEKRVCALGGGAVVFFMDKTTLYDRKLYDKAFRLGKAEAIKMQTKAISLNPNFASAFNELGLTYCKQRKLDEAMNAHKKALELDPKLGTAHNYLGVVYLLKGMSAEADAEFNEFKKYEAGKQMGPSHGAPSSH